MILTLLISLILQVAGGDTISSALLRSPVRVNATEMASPPSEENEEESVPVAEIIFEHIGDEYEWHITEWKGKAIAIPLPCIVIENGVHVFTIHHAAENG